MVVSISGVIIHLGRLNMGHDHLSRLESTESEGSLDDQMPDVNLFRVEAIPYYLEELVAFLATGKCLHEYTTMQDDTWSCE